MDGWMNEWVNKWLTDWMKEWMNERMNGLMRKLKIQTLKLEICDSLSSSTHWGNEELSPDKASLFCMTVLTINPVKKSHSLKK